MESLIIPGRPVPKGRHKVRLYGGKVITYTPAKTREYEEAVRVYARKHAIQKQDGPLAVIATFYTTGPGDVDNLLKSLLDGLNGIAWDDDSQVKGVVALKKTCPKGQECTQVLIVELEWFLEWLEEKVG